ncbi:DNA-binding protein [Cryobacterium adonitolivorans]|uniref:DNA-binding protein n=1 Tax=Cryobacterium adonitolivorans TaxID=1259189 RepID=A0A4R8W4I5_9MICO|nr:helix-turn-helix domain-containing protein [Cryobacterium adonitolivorans]TFC01496.1 DNA-binding protein [Cryobacterium adonitolivorans]
MNQHGAFDVTALDDMFADLPKTLSPEQAAELFGVTVITIRNLITKNSDDPLPAIKIGKVWVILRDDFKAWLLRRSNNITD